MTPPAAVNSSVAAVPVGGLAPVVGPGGVQAPAPAAAPTPQVQRDGVDHIPHADVVLKDVLVHSQRLTGPMTPLQVAQAQLALARHKDVATPFGSDPRFGLAPGKESAGAPGKLGENVPGVPAQVGSNGEVINKAAQPGGPTANGAAPPAQAQAPAQAPAPMLGQAGALVNPNPPPPPQAPAARDARRRERWRPRAPRQNPEANGREGSERNRGG